MQITFKIPITPVAKGRPRMTKTGRVYTPAKTVAYEKQVAIAAKGRCHKVIEGPVQLSLVFYLPRPKYMDKPKYPTAGAVRHTVKPDLDNLIKAIKDALNGIAWKDDCQVYSVVAKKFYAARGEDPCVVVGIAEQEEEDNGN